MEDRQSANPGRVKFTLDDGTVMFGTIERADSPSVAGTPINKNTLFNSKNSERYVADLPSEAFELIGKVWGTFTLTASGWSSAVNSEGYYTQEVSIDGMSSQYYPTVIPVYSSATARDEEKFAFGQVDMIDTVDGKIIAKATEVPEYSVSFILAGV